jgi:hypothetical protein
MENDTPEEPRMYGQWAGNPKGYREDPARCIIEVYPTRCWISYQCKNKRGHGKDGLYCKHHAKKDEEIRERQIRWNEE